MATKECEEGPYHVMLIGGPCHAKCLTIQFLRRGIMVPVKRGHSNFAAEEYVFSEVRCGKDSIYVYLHEKLDQDEARKLALETVAAIANAHIKKKAVEPLFDGGYGVVEKDAVAGQ